MRIAILAIFAALASAPASAADRLTDHDVKTLVERIDDERNHFEDALSDRVKHRTIPAPSADLAFGRYLHEFKESVARLREHLDRGRSANTEAGVVLRQASAIDAFVRQLPSGTRGASEWRRLAADLKTIAVAYGADLPLRADAVVGRMADRDVAALADDVARTGERLHESLDAELARDSGVGKHGREAIAEEADRLSQAAEILRDRVKDGAPSSSELDRLLAQASRTETRLGEYPTPASRALWGELASRLAALADAYHVDWRGARSSAR